MGAALVLAQVLRGPQRHCVASSRGFAGLSNEKTPDGEGWGFFWWDARESNTAPIDYESTALTKHELASRNFCYSAVTWRLRLGGHYLRKVLILLSLIPCFNILNDVA